MKYVTNSMETWRDVHFLLKNHAVFKLPPSFLLKVAVGFPNHAQYETMCRSSMFQMVTSPPFGLKPTAL